jgi:hypothetical protein
MRATYLWLSRLLALLVVVQAMTIVFAVSGLFSWVINDGGVLDESTYKSWQDSPPTWTGAIGHGIHLLAGERVIPVIALLLLIVSFFAKVPKGVAIAAVLFVLVLAQTVSGIKGHAMPYLGLWHGLGAFLIFGAAMAGAMAAKKAPDAAASVSA